ncbi:MAG: hypothetical protein LBR17_04845 [Bacteroidales bacterium]|jgi:hypothetical protein|nr:hypothetical protein [Bacteroidales bacterium]
MKRIILISLLAFVGLNVAQAQRDWRQGMWNKNIPEHFLTFDVGGSYAITANYKDMNPFAVNAQVGYQYKIRPFVKNRLGVALGASIGYAYHPSNDYYSIDGSIKLGEYKSYHYIPVMLNANLYYNMRTAYIYLGIDAGVNLQLCEKDYQGEYITTRIDTTVMVDTFIVTQTSIPNNVTYFASAKEGNPLALSHIVPSAKVYLGFMKELTTNLRLRFRAGIEYNMGYELEYQGILLNGSYVEMNGKIKIADDISPFLTVGLVYSL